MFTTYGAIIAHNTAVTLKFWAKSLVFWKKHISFAVNHKIGELCHQTEL